MHRAPADAPTVLLLHGAPRNRRAQLVSLLRTAGRALQRVGRRSSGPRTRRSGRTVAFGSRTAPPTPAAVIERCDSGSGHRSRLLDGRADRAVAVARPPPRRRGHGLRRDGAEFRKGNRHRYVASALLLAAAGTRVGARRPGCRRGSFAPRPPTPDRGNGPTPSRPGAVPRWPSTAAVRCSRRPTRSPTTARRTGSARSTCPRRSSSPRTIPRSTRPPSCAWRWRYPRPTSIGFPEAM